MQAVDGRSGRLTARGLLQTNAGLWALLVVPSLLTLAGVSVLRIVSDSTRPPVQAGTARNLPAAEDIAVASGELARELLDSFRDRSVSGDPNTTSPSGPIWLHLPPDLFAAAPIGQGDPVDSPTNLDSQSVAVDSVPTEFASVNAGTAQSAPTARQTPVPRPPVKGLVSLRPAPEYAPTARRAAASAPPSIELPYALRPLATTAPE
jgi:hypothetical protein